MARSTHVHFNPRPGDPDSFGSPCRSADPMLRRSGAQALGVERSRTNTNSCERSGDVHRVVYEMSSFGILADHHV